MARVRISLEDDNGNLLISGKELLYSLSGQCNSLDAIENAVEDFRKKALPDIEKALLVNAQDKAIENKKKA